MGIVFRQSIKTTIVVFIGAILGALTNYGYAHLLTEKVFGFTRLTFAQGGLIQLLVIVGTSGVVITYIRRFTDPGKKKVVLFFAAITPFITTLLLTIPYLIFRTSIVHIYRAQDQEMVNTYYLWLPVLVLLWSYMNQIEVYLSTQHKTAISIFMREVVLRAINIALLLLYYYGHINFSGFLISSILIYALPTLLMLPIAMRTDSFGFSIKLKVFNKPEYKELIHFSWYHLLMGISVNAMLYMDSYMLGIFSKNGVASLSVYAIAVFITMISVIPYRAMVAAAFPAINAVYISNESKKLHDMFHRSSLNILIVGVAMTTIIACCMDDAVAILPASYRVIKPLVFILLIGRLFDMATGLNSELIGISRYYKFNFRISLLLVLLLFFFCRLIIPYYDVYGAAWATTMSLVCFNLGKMIFLHKKMRLQPFSKGSLLILFSGCIAALAGYFLPYLVNPFIDAIARTMVIITIYGAMLVWLKPSQDLTVYLKSIRENKRLF